MSATMYRPGTHVEVTDQPGPVSAPTDTDAWFVTGVADSGPVGRAVLIRSLDHFKAVFGERRADSLLCDSVETYLREGGARCYVSRVGSVGGVAATGDLLTATSTVALHAEAKSPGASGNDISITAAEMLRVPSAAYASVYGAYDGTSSPEFAKCTMKTVGSAGNEYVLLCTAGAVSGFTIVLKDSSQAVVEDPAQDFATIAEFVDWANANSTHYTATLTLEGTPVPGSSSQFSNGWDGGEPTGFYTLSVSEAGVIKETSPECSHPSGTDAVTWAATSSTLITLTSGGVFVGVPAPQTVALTGGGDGEPTDTDWTTALTAFSAALGPGQVSAPGRTTSQSHQAVNAHAMGNNRVALLDGTDTPDPTALVSLVSGCRIEGDQDHYGGLFAPWAIIQGLAPGTLRQVPWSAIQAGIYARNERAGLSPAQPGAGQQYGRSRTALALTQRYTDADRDLMTRGGVNTARDDLGVVESYGHRTIADAAKFPQWRELGQVRLLMAITAESEAIAEQHLFAILDGRRHEIAKFGGELTGMLIPYYEDGSLYGDSPEEAFRVDVGQAVNTEASIAAGELRAVIGVRCSHMAELVYIEIVKTETTQAL